jgi:hypothetical protein
MTLRRRRVAVVSTIAIVLSLLSGSLVHALFTRAKSVGGNALVSDTLNPPTALNAVSGSTASLSWTATSDLYASGYRVYRSTVSGGGYTLLATVTPRTTTTYVDASPSGVYYYVVRALYQNWESANSNQVSATTTSAITLPFVGCAANAADTGGDGNGFQGSPGNACADDGAVANDSNSGTNLLGDCTSTGKDRHLFWNYSLNLPGTVSAINGIEVRVDGFISNNSGTYNGYCVQLSWDAGTSWTTLTATGPRTAVLTTGELAYVVGGSSDTWGHTWTTSELSNANFRVRLVTVTTGNNSQDPRVDFVGVRVTYTP